MFRWISIISFAAIFAWILVHYFVITRGNKTGSPGHRKMCLLSMLCSGQKRCWSEIIRKLVVLFGIISFIVLFLTGFGPLLLGGKLQGYLLMIHATFAPVFIICLTLFAVLRAGKYSFNDKDADWLDHIDQGCSLINTDVGKKTGFWLLLILSLPLILSMTFSMLPLFGTQGQEILFDLHRISALFFVLTAVVELYILARAGKDISTS